MCELPALEALHVDPSFWDAFELTPAVQAQSALQKLAYIREMLGGEEGAVK